MVRPRKPRLIEREPEATYFKPRGVPLSQLEEVVLTFGEFEAMRLSDFEGLSQITAAKQLGVHQSTFHRTLARARKKIADAIANGKAIRIQGGVYKKMPGINMTGPTPGSGAGRGMNRGFGYGGPQNCKCSSCGHLQTHVRGVPCIQTKCEKCGSTMVRGDV